jgi:hypothetical protein
MAADGRRDADVELVASAAADQLRFDAQPEVQIRFPGTGKRDSHQVTERQNIDSPIRPGKTYRRVFARTRITSRVLEDGLD